MMWECPDGIRSCGTGWRRPLETRQARPRELANLIAGLFPMQNALGRDALWGCQLTPIFLNGSLCPFYMRMEAKMPSMVPMRITPAKNRGMMRFTTVSRWIRFTCFQLL